MTPLAPIALILAGVLALVFSRPAGASIAPRSPDPGANGPGTDQDGSGSSEIEELGRWTLPASGAPYEALIESAALNHSIPERLLARVLYEESRFRPDIIDGSTRSSAGAIGIAQFMPATADELGIDPLDPAQAIEGAARYLRQLHDRFGNWREAVAAYNWGMGNVSRKGLANAPTETRNYYRNILTDVYGSIDV